MKNRFLVFNLLFFLVVGLNGCGTVREVPVKTITKEIVRDSIVIKHDTIKIEIPRESIKEVIPEIDTSRLETNVAESIAYLDTAKRVIHHELTNKQTEFKKPVEIKEKIITVEKEVEKEVPVEVPVPFMPKWVWILIIFNVGYFGLKLGKYILP